MPVSVDSGVMLLRECCPRCVSVDVAMLKVVRRSLATPQDQCVSVYCACANNNQVGTCVRLKLKRWIMDKIV